MKTTQALTRDELRSFIYDILQDFRAGKLTIAQAQKRILKANVQASKFLFLQRPWNPLRLHSCMVRVSYQPILRRLNRDVRTHRNS